MGYNTSSSIKRKTKIINPKNLLWLKVDLSIYCLVN